MFDFNFDWKPELDTKIEAVDIQHRQLFTIGRDLEQMVRVECIGVTDKQLLDIVCRLRDYTGYHFYEEEQLMKECKYPELEQHAREHAKYTQAVMKIDLPRLKADPAKGISKIKDDLQTAIFAHMLTSDVKFTEYLKNVQAKNAQENIEDQSADSDNGQEQQHPYFGRELCKLNVSRVYMQSNETLPGWLNLVYLEKVKDFSDLTALERNTYFADLAKASRIIKKVCGADAVEYGFFPDMQEQLHFQLVPKYRDKEEWGTPYTSMAETKKLPLQQEQELYLKLKKELEK